MIFVDASVFMYAAGVDHPNRAPSLGFLRRVAEGEIDAAIDAEILQEILHRYRAIGRWSDGKKVYDLARQIVSLVFPVGAEILDRTRELLDRHQPLMARDALHAAAVELCGGSAICSFDRDFDRIEGLRRIQPES